MCKAGYALFGSLLGAGAVVALIYVLFRVSPMNGYGALIYLYFGGCWFAFIGAILGALGGLAVERRRSVGREQNNPPK